MAPKKARFQLKVSFRGMKTGPIIGLRPVDEALRPHSGDEYKGDR
jgi:hypothetical protein